MKIENELASIRCDINALCAEVRKPRVGCPHFRKMVKQIRGDNNNIYTCISDIVDNADKAERCNVELVFIGDKIHKIIISDNLITGFEGLNESGIHHPLNMTHDRDGQSDDDISSEFGRGMKVSMIYLGDTADIYTRTIDGKCTHMHFDFPEQMAKEDASDSFEPSEIESRTVAQYRKNHQQFETGSSIACSSLRTDKEFQFLSKDVCIEQIRKYLQETFSDKIAKGFGLSLNGSMIEPLPNYTEGVSKYTHKLFIDLNNEDQILNILVERTHPTGTVTYFDRELKSMTELEFSADVNEDRCEILTMESAIVLDSALMFSNRIRVKRNGRRHGDIEPFKKKNQDGYANHIYNEINYMCKRLNQYMGVGANKRISSDKDTPLIQTLRLIQNFTTSSLIKKSEKKVETAEEKQIRILAEQEKERCRIAEEVRKQQEKEDKKRIVEEKKQLKEAEKKLKETEKERKRLEDKTKRDIVLTENAIEQQRIADEHAIEQQKLAELEQHATYIVNAHLLCNGSGSEMVQLESNLKMIAEQSGDEESSDLDEESSGLDEEFELAVQLLPVETKQPQFKPTNNSIRNADLHYLGSMTDEDISPAYLQKFNVQAALDRLIGKLLSGEDSDEDNQSLVDDFRLFMIKHNLV